MCCVLLFVCYTAWHHPSSSQFLQLLFFAFVRQYTILHILSTFLCVDECVHIFWHDSLIEVGFRNWEEAAVSLGSHSEDEGLSSEDGKMANKLSGVCHKQTCVFFTVNHPLVNMEEARYHKLDAHLLQPQGEKESQEEQRHYSL